MDRDRQDNPDAGIVDDKVAEARERIGRIEKTVGGPSVEGQKEAQGTEERLPEREEFDQASKAWLSLTAEPPTALKVDECSGVGVVPLA
jgi:hypothetical protein